MLFTEVIAPNPTKWSQLGPKPNKVVLLPGKVENKKYSEIETRHAERLEECSYYRLSENF